jgi:hypothetical protein
MRNSTRKQILLAVIMLVFVALAMFGGLRGLTVTH